MLCVKIMPAEGVRQRLWMWAGPLHQTTPR